MKREILFRGKRIDNGEWAEGGAVVDSDSAHIVYQINEHIKRDDYECYAVEVDSATISQFTGLIDNNGKKIFENDVIAATFNSKIKLFTCYWSKESSAFYLSNEFYPIWGRLSRLFEIADEDGGLVSLIGNIFDNPELVVKHK